MLVRDFMTDEKKDYVVIKLFIEISGKWESEKWYYCSCWSGRGGRGV